MTPPPPNAASVAVAFDEASDVAAQLAEWAAIVVAEPEMETAAHLALGIATAASASASRRIAIADLCGELTPVYALAGGEDAPGLADSDCTKSLALWPGTHRSSCTVGTVIPPARRWRKLRAVCEYAGGAVATDTVLMGERLGPVDSARLSPFAVEVVAASSASNANSVLQDHINEASLPAATIAVLSVRSCPQRTSKWHKVMVGAWHDANTADSALLAMRRERVLEREGGIVVRAPYAMLLADSVSHEQARAVVNRWRTKGLAPYALTQDDGTVRVYAGAFETVAQMVTMAAIVHDSGGTPMVAFRTGRPD